MKLNAEMAYRTVDLVYAESGLKAIVCDTSGIIIAAVDKERIGTVHSGACRILRDGLDEVVITPEEEAQSGGLVRVGYNLPIKNDAEVVGVYGIGGETARVRSVARISVGLIRNALNEEKTQRQIAEKEQRLQSLFSQMAEGVALHEVLLDEAGKPINYRIVAVNDSYEKDVGLKREDVCGKLGTEVYGTPDAPFLQKFAAVGLTGVPNSLEVYFEPLDKHFVISVAPWGNKGFATIFSDVSERKRMEEMLLLEITERKRAQQALQESHDSLERKVEERTQELTAANEELRALNEEMIAMNEDLVHTNERLQTMQSYLIQSEKMAALGNLVAGIAHEINTPIGVGVTAASHLNNLTEEFAMACAKAAPSRRDMDEYMEDAQASSSILLKNLERASRLIKSFKQVSVDQSNESCRSFAVREYLDEILLSLNPHLRKTNQAVLVECDPQLKVSGYPGALAQIITNLIMNSLLHAYTPEIKGTIRIVAAMKAGQLEIRYSDDGKGIEPAVAARIFEPFFTTRRGSGGTGLGLFVVYNIVSRQLKGTIDCQSEPGQGATFTVKFPCGGVGQ